MGVFLTTVAFLLLCGVGFFLTERFVKSWLPEKLFASRWSVRTISLGLALAGAYFIIAWGYNPAVITVNLQQPILDPLRWVNWVLSALFFGASEAFLIDILRGVRPRRRDELL